jgi:putative uncharacterized protein XOO0504
MRHLAVLVEEESMKVFLEGFLPERLDRDWTFEAHSLQGKHRLLKRAVKLAKGHHDSGHHVLILVDRDASDCIQLKKQLTDSLASAGLSLASAKQRRTGDALVRIVVQELEAWFLCDPALLVVYPGIRSGYRNARRYRDPEGIPDCWESLRDLVHKAGYDFSKVSCARRMSHLMAQREDDTCNDSASFQHFVRGLSQLTGEGKDR